MDELCVLHDEIEQNYGECFSIESSCISNYLFEERKGGKLILRACTELNKNDVVVVYRGGVFEVIIIQDGWRIEESVQIMGKIKYCEIEL